MLTELVVDRIDRDRPILVADLLTPEMIFLRVLRFLRGLFGESGPLTTELMDMASIVRGVGTFLLRVGVIGAGSSAGISSFRIGGRLSKGWDPFGLGDGDDKIASRFKAEISDLVTRREREEIIGQSKYIRKFFVGHT